MSDTQKPRIEPILPSEWDEEILDALGAFPSSLNFVLSRWNEKSEDIRGMHVLGFFATHPALAKAFLTLNKHVAADTTLTTRERELLILRIGWLTKSEYEFGQHIILGRRAGITDDEILRLQAGPDTAGWSEDDADLIRAADDLHFRSRLSDSTWEKLSKRYDHKQIMDLIFVVGVYALMATAINTYNIPAEPGAADLDPEVRARMLQQ